MSEHNRKYEIGKPSEYTTLSFLKKAAKKPVRAVQKIAAAQFPEVVEKRAVWVVHGMGQQVPFETVDALAQGILGAAASQPNGWQVDLPPRVATTKFTSPDDPSKTQIVQRVEIDFHKAGSPQTRLQLHLYEAYWAPLTEGVAKLRDVLSFLYDGALHGLLSSFKPFRRAMFPDDTSPVTSPPLKAGKIDSGIWTFYVRKVAAAQISLLVLLVLAIGVIDAVIVAASAVKLNCPVLCNWPIREYWNQLTALATALTAMALTFGAVLFLSEMSKREKMSKVSRAVLIGLSWMALAITASSILFGAALMALVTRISWFANWLRSGFHYHATQIVSTSAIVLAAALCVVVAALAAKKRSRGEDHRVGWFPMLAFILGYLLHITLLCLLVLVQLHRFFDPNALRAGWREIFFFLGWPYWVWPALLALSKLVGDIIVEYPGDVAIYVAPNKLDRFNDTRQKIKQLALESLTPLYSSLSADQQEWQYSKVALVGHSLGSVIAYDTLNKLLILDDLLGNQFDVADRTCLLETFGSPLDKTAFFFSYQGKENFNIREQLAASVQPLIQSYDRYRRFPWINVFTPSDIICGRLTFYDVNPPSSAIPPATSPVNNVQDFDAVVPLVAHVEYWKNPTVWNRLMEIVTA